MELSTDMILTVIRSRESGDAAKVLKRTHTCLALFYDPDIEPETKAAMRESFVTALRDFPLWAVMRAFDAWERQHKRRPSPGEIVTLAQQELQPFTAELARREREAARIREEQDRRPSVTAERATAILEAAGFTPKRMAAVRAAPMAGSMDEAMQRAETGAMGSLTSAAREAINACPAVQRARQA
jgi:hypothetical protein